MPLTSLSFHLTREPAQAKTWFAGLTERVPAAMSVIGSVTDGLVIDPTRYENPRWWAGRDASGEVVAAFMHTPPHPLHIAFATPEQARDLAEHCATQGDSLPGVAGVRDSVEAFRDEWVQRTGVRASTVMEVGAFELPDRPELPFGVPGAYRLATRDDLDLVDAWAQDFVDAIEHRHRTVNSLGIQVDAGRVGLWVDSVEGGEQPVSMAYASPANGGITRISGVWTPPPLRGRGYASGVVAALSTERMAAGERCILFTDLANPTSNKIYQAMGYRRIGDNITIEFA